MENDVESALKDFTATIKEFHPVDHSKNRCLEDKYEECLVNKSENSQARLFFHHFKFLDALHLKNNLMLKESEAFRKAIKKIDKMPIRTTQIIPFLYAKNIEDLSYETNYLVDDYFNNFLNSLGIKLDDKHICSGNFLHIKKLLKNTGVVYDANLLTELIFVVPTLKLNHKTTVSLIKPKYIIGSRKNNTRCKYYHCMECKDS